MPEYRIEWSIQLDAENKYDAVQQAWALMEDATHWRTGATVLFVSDPWGKDKTMIDMEVTGFCDTCDKPYCLQDIEDHCTECGSCLEHCSNPKAHDLE